MANNKTVGLGKQFEDALNRLERAEVRKVDIYEKPKNIKLINAGEIEIGRLGKVNFTKTGFQSFCSSLELPSGFVEKLMEDEGKTIEEATEDTAIAKTLFQRGIDRAGDSIKLFRSIKDTETNEHTVRAVFSDQYRLIDNLPILQQLSNYRDSNIKTESFYADFDYMDMRFTMPDLQRSIGRLPDKEQRFGMTEDILFPGIHLRNSETGKAQIEVSFIVYRLVCTNGLVNERHQHQVLRRRHIGDVNIADVTTKLNGAVAIAEEMFNQYVDVFSDAKAVVVDEPTELFESFRKRDGITKAMTESMISNWATEQDMSRRKFAVVNAITASARDWHQNKKDYSGRLKMESLAGELLFAKHM